MNKEYKEFMGKLEAGIKGVTFAQHLNRYSPFSPDTVGAIRELVLGFEYKGCRIAVVKKEPELPKLKSLAGEASLEEKAGFLNGVKEAQEIMLARNFVQEVPNEKV